MAEAKLEIKVGAVSFCGEGNAVWLSQQLDKLLKQLPELTKTTIPEVNNNGSSDASADHKPETHGKSTGTLAAFLKAKKATNKQARKFLATATWLHDVEGKKRLITSDVTKALNDHNQGKLSNPAQCLINNAKTGCIVKDGKKQFYVADKGREELEK